MQTKARTRVCNKCGKRYLATSKYFHRQKRGKYGLKPTCRKCCTLYNKKHWAKHGEQIKQHRKENRETGRNHELKSRYGINLKQYNQMFERQKGRCAVCGKHQAELTVSLCVDHNHKTGKVRGLLCPRCNVKLGIIEDKEFLEKSKIYLMGE